MLKISEQGLCFDALMPTYGQQAFGISPKGALDQLSYQEAKVLLGEPECHQVVEIVYPPKFEFTQDSIFVLTGAHFDNAVLLYRDRHKLIAHATVIFAPANSQLILKKKTYGFRGYLAVSSLTEQNKKRIGLRRGLFSRWFHWYEINQPIRVMEAPEVDILDNQKDFLGQRWKISPHSDNMGLRLMSEVPLKYEAKSMISEAVTDGTIQLTQDGPIVLLRHRQCTGGYPRIYNVISADVDMLAQYIPGQTLHFSKVTLDEALELKYKKETDFEVFKAFFMDN
ncbi:hydrolase [Thiotrichales bacterium 19S3-7]|nr:hydrolase [Thiotrichales bacterium 19S3-7]MCF6801886.1 hydrolase [Thiotrichales bacterium 19S3-11]